MNESLCYNSLIGRKDFYWRVDSDGSMTLIRRTGEGDLKAEVTITSVKGEKIIADIRSNDRETLSCLSQAESDLAFRIANGSAFED
jgi:hypothetical protein